MAKVMRAGDRTDFLDGCRGLAALYVVIYHARYLLAQDLAVSEQSSWLEKIQYYGSLPFFYGHQAVIFFFVLSGFVIHLSHAKALARQPATFQFSWEKFVMRRIRRLYPPLILAIGVTSLLDFAGMSQGFAIYFSRTDSALINATIRPDYSLRTLAGNLVFLMESYVPAWGTDGPLWSLHYEWWFYMVYPAFLMLTRKSAGFAALVMALLAASVWLPVFRRMPWMTACAWYTNIFAMFPLWWMGAILADVYVGRIRIPLACVAALLLLLPLGLKTDVLHSYALAAGFVGGLALLLELRRRGFSLWPVKPARVAGKHVLHAVRYSLSNSGFCGGFIMSRTADGMLPRHYGYAAAGILMALAVSYAAHFLVERPFLPRRSPMPEPSIETPAACGV